MISICVKYVQKIEEHSVQKIKLVNSKKYETTQNRATDYYKQICN